MAYSPERRAAVVAKMLPPNNVALSRLSKDEGISVGTLGKWRAEARAHGQFLPDAQAGPEGCTSEDKLAAVIGTTSMNETDLSESCRQRGVYPEQIDVWRQACGRTNCWDRTATQRITRETKDDKTRIQALERELARKEKALAEASALMILRKKADAIWGWREVRRQPDRAVLWTDRSKERPEPLRGAGGREARTYDACSRSPTYHCPHRRGAGFRRAAEHRVRRARASPTHAAALAGHRRRGLRGWPPHSGATRAFQQAGR